MYLQIHAPSQVNRYDKFKTMKKRIKRMLSGQANHDQIDDLPAGGCRSNRCGYEIRVKDHLDPSWWQWFEDWSLVNLDSGEVLMISSEIDQAALHGALNKIRDLNLTLISVKRKE
jgi:hypothetical protein